MKALLGNITSLSLSRIYIYLFFRVGVLFPSPSPSAIKRLCTGDASVLNKLEAVLRAPTFVEYFNLNAGFGYGVYATGHSIGFHYTVNGPDAHPN